MLITVFIAINCFFLVGGERLTTPACQSYEFQCWDGQCIPEYYVCNSYPDCSQGEDEIGCVTVTSLLSTSEPISLTTLIMGTTTKCSDYEYECTDGKCLPKAYVCDGMADCSQGEDEQDCSSTVTAPPPPSPPPGCDDTQFECWDKKCIPLTWVCDGESDWPGTTTYVPPPPACEHPYDTVGDRCVVIEPVLEATWDEARYLCERIDGDLVIIDSMDFFSKLIQYINDNGLISRDYWVGGTNRDKEGEWKWINGANITMGTPLWSVYRYGTGFYEQEPRGGSDTNCGYLDKTRFYYMDDYDCLETKAAICQMPTWSAEDPAFIPKVEIVDEEKKKEIIEMAKMNHQ